MRRTYSGLQRVTNLADRSNPLRVPGGRARWWRYGVGGTIGVRPLDPKSLPWHIRSAASLRVLGVGSSREVISLPGLGSHAVKLVTLYGSCSGRCASVECR